MFTFVEFRSFTRRLQELGGDSADEVLLRIQNDLIANPERGDLVRGLGGIRKARCADPARRNGTRGGFRYLYYFIREGGQVFLMFLFDKNKREGLTDDQKKTLRRTLDILRRDQS